MAESSNSTALATRSQPGQSTNAPNVPMSKLPQLSASSPSPSKSRSSQLSNATYRPSVGKSGKAVVVKSNFFTLTTDDETICYRYAIICHNPSDKDANKPLGKKLRQLVRLFMEKYFKDLHIHFVTDYSAIILSRSRLESKFDEFEGVVKYKSEHSSTASDEKLPEFKMTLKFQYQFRWTGLAKDMHLPTDSPIESRRNDLLQAMNIIISHNAKQIAFDPTKMLVIGPNSYRDPGSLEEGRRVELGGGMFGLKGFLSSVRPGGGGKMLLNIQTKAAAIYTSQNLQKLLIHLRAYFNEENETISRYIEGLRVSYTDPKQTTRVRTIVGTASESDGKCSIPEKSMVHPPKSERPDAGSVQFWVEPTALVKLFPTKTFGRGQYISCKDYFFHKYKVNIPRDTIMVNVGKKLDPIYIPASHCEICAGQPAKRILDSDQLNEIRRIAMQTPEKNRTSIEKASITDIPLTNNKGMVNFGLQSDNKLKQVQARQLGSPDILYEGNTVQKKAGSGQWNLIEVKMVEPTKIDIMPVICGRNVKYPHLNQRLNSLEKQLRTLGISWDDDQYQDKIFVHEGLKSFVEYVQDTMSRITNILRKAIESGKKVLCLIILPEDKAIIFNTVKKMIDVDFGFHSLCVLQSKFLRKPHDAPYDCNLALKINLKLGGRNHELSKNSLSRILGNDTMLVGMDVTHPSPGSSDEAPSIAGSVASIDGHATQYHPSVYTQDRRRQEMIDHIEPMMKDHLHFWKQKNGSLPKNVIVYRDGVSDGQYLHILQNEKPKIQQAFNALYHNQKHPALTIIVVGKRHHVRFYPEPKHNPFIDRSGNARPGLVVDTGITEDKLWDFYLQSHTALHGTARPAHYVVLHDEIFRAKMGSGAADAVQSLTFNLCFMFARATVPVSIVPPVYYADRLCDRVRRHKGKLFEVKKNRNVESESGGSRGKPDKFGPAMEYTVGKSIQDSMWFV